jgi:hypothetical protein
MFVVVNSAKKYLNSFSGPSILINQHDKSIISKAKIFSIFVVQISKAAYQKNRFS